MSVGERLGSTARLAARGGYREVVAGLRFGGVVFGLMHHADHVIRGNHSGWPFQAEVTPFTFSLLIYALILPGIYMTAKGRDVAGYHLFVGVVGLALLGTVHFVPTGGQESPMRDIYMVYGSPLAGAFALVVLAGLMTSVALLSITAFRALRARPRATTTEGG
jgi:hypothetical protein